MKTKGIKAVYPRTSLQNGSGIMCSGRLSIPSAHSTRRGVLNVKISVLSKCKIDSVNTCQIRKKSQGVGPGVRKD